jgi:uncharacterized membrane protein
MNEVLGAFHPQVVHFAIALVFAGVLFRLLSLTRIFSFAGPAATTLILLGTLACFAAVHTGTLAHGPVERIPGVRPAVVEHEEWGERTRNLFAVISILELAALFTAWRQTPRAYVVSLVAAVAGLGGLAAMYETAEHGGELVYSYAGGVGIRTGEPDDVNRMFVAGAYQQALQDRQKGRNQEAMQIVELAAARFPSNLELQLMAAEWTTEVKQDPAAALQRLEGLQIAADDTRSRVRAGMARANALLAQGNRDGAKAVVQTLAGEFPANLQVKRRLDELSAPQP